jgi:hypothetical protein
MKVITFDNLLFALLWCTILTLFNANDIKTFIIMLALYLVTFYIIVYFLYYMNLWFYKNVIRS